MDHDTVDSNPKCATARRHVLVKTYRIVMNHIFMINKILKKQKSPFFRASAEFTERRREKRKNGDFCFFRKSIKSKITVLSQFWDLYTLKA